MRKYLIGFCDETYYVYDIDSYLDRDAFISAVKYYLGKGYVQELRGYKYVVLSKKKDGE